MAVKRTSNTAALFPFAETLRDGTQVLVRQVRPDDKELLQAAMKALSNESRRFRFLHSVADLPDAMLRQFTEVDHVDHEAIVAFDVSGSA